MPLDDQPIQPRRYRMSDALSDAMVALASRGPSRQNSVRLIVQANGDVLPEVTAVHDDLQEAERQALEVLRSLQRHLPAVTPPPDSLKVSLTRNAKGETQIDVEHKGDDADTRAMNVYESLRARYPLADGKATHDAPPRETKP